MGHAYIGLDPNQKPHAQLLAGSGQLGPTESAISQKNHSHTCRQHRDQQPQESFLEAVLRTVELPIGVTGPQKRDGSTTQNGSGHERVECADLCPVEGYQQSFFALFGESVDDPSHGIGDVDAIVVAEPPGALDAAFGGGVCAEGSSDGRECGPSDVCGSFDEVGESFSLAESDASGYGENPADDGIGIHGGSSAMGQTSCVVTTLLAQPHCGWNRLLHLHHPKLTMTQATEARNLERGTEDNKQLLNDTVRKA